MSTGYICAACGRDGLTELTAVHVVGTKDYLCGRARKMDPQIGRGYEGSAELMCLNNYVAVKAIRDRQPHLFRVEPIQEMKAVHNSTRV